MSKKLTPKQAQFVIEYLIDLNATQAAIRAGYSENTANEIGCQNLAKLNISQAIQKQLDARAERTQITADYVLSSFKEIADRCMQKVPVMVRDGKRMVQKQEYVENEEGEEVLCDVWQFNSLGASKALDSLSRNLSLYNDKPIVDQSQHNHITYAWNNNNDSVQSSEISRGNPQRQPSV